jgi:hypothetical protein
LSGDQRHEGPTNSSISKLGFTRDKEIELELSPHRFNTIEPYCCSFPGCYTTFRSKHDWKMHEEGHWAPKCYFCPFCATVKRDLAGNHTCIGCSQTFDSYFTVDVAGSHILQCELAQEQSQKFSSYDHLCTHLRIQHDIKNFDPHSAASSFPIESSWPRNCNFCGTKFSHWERRVDHIGAHFLQGANISEVSLRFSQVEKDSVKAMAEHGALTSLGP